jgi:hypothetical protein
MYLCVCVCVYVCMYVRISHSTPLDIQRSVSSYSDVSDSQYFIVSTHLLLRFDVTQLDGKQWKISLQNCNYRSVYSLPEKKQITRSVIHENVIRKNG